MPAVYEIDPMALLTAGVHFGHKVSRWNPKMAPYIYGKRNLIHIINVRQTVQGLIKACHFLEQLAARGDLVLLVGTKRQASAVVKEQAKRCGMPYVAERWLGGTLTNYATIRERLNRLRQIEQWETDGTIHRYGKKEQAAIQREKRKLVRNLDGIRDMDRIPAALVVIDPIHEAIAVSEADKVGAATVALIDTDGNPDLIDIPVPGNDDSMKVIQIVMSKVAEAILAGRARAVQVVVPAAEPEAVVSVGGRRERGIRPEKVGAISVGGRPPAEKAEKRPRGGSKAAPAAPSTT